MSNKDKERAVIVVVGGGIVGISTAIWLARAGRKVTLVDRNEIGDKQGASYGNAGVLAACSVVPVTVPGLVAKAPKLLFDPNFPLFLRLSYLPRLTPWLLKYLSHANDKDTRRIAKGLTPLIHDAVEQHQALAAGTCAESWIEPSSYGFVYPSRAEFDADSYTWARRSDAGFEPEVIEGAAVHEMEPALADNLNLIALMKDHAFVHSPGDYLLALKQVAQTAGATVMKTAVRDFEFSDGRVSAVLTDAGALACDSVVLAAGAWSKPLARKLGLDVPLESERGYHIRYSDASPTPNIPLMITTGKFVATPMAGGLRCAGIVEFGGLNAPASRAPLNFLRKKIRATFPKLKAHDEQVWLGHRPAPSDSLPLIGEFQRSGVFLGFGHHHIGLTAGPKTGRILANLIANRRENTDLAPYSPNRFGAGRNYSRKPSKVDKNMEVTMSKKIKLGIATAAVVTVAASGVQAETWDLPMAYAATNFHSATGAEFAKCVTLGTGGKLKIQTHPGGSLYAGAEIKRAIQSGQVNIGERLLSANANEEPVFGVDSIPFLATSFEDSEKLWEVTKGPLSEILEKQNLHLLYSVPWPAQGLYFDREVNSLADAKGLKFRTYNASSGRMAELAGMQPVQIEAAEISQAFATGVAQGMVSSGSTGYDRKVWESLSHYYAADAWMPRNHMLVNKNAWDALDDATRNVMNGCAALAEYAGDWRSIQYTEFTVNQLALNGMSVGKVSATLEAELKAIGETMTDEWLEQAGDAGRAIVEAYRAK